MGSQNGARPVSPNSAMLEDRIMSFDSKLEETEKLMNNVLDH